MKYEECSKAAFLKNLLILAVFLLIVIAAILYLIPHRDIAGDSRNYHDHVILYADDSKRSGLLHSRSFQSSFNVPFKSCAVAKEVMRIFFDRPVRVIGFSFNSVFQPLYSSVKVMASISNPFGYRLADSMLKSQVQGEESFNSDTVLHATQGNGLFAGIDSSINFSEGRYLSVSTEEYISVGAKLCSENPFSSDGFEIDYTMYYEWENTN